MAEAITSIGDAVARLSPTQAPIGAVAMATAVANVASAHAAAATPEGDWFLTQEANMSILDNGIYANYQVLRATIASFFFYAFCRAFACIMIINRYISATSAPAVATAMDMVVTSVVDAVAAGPAAYMEVIAALYTFYINYIVYQIVEDVAAFA